MQARTRHDVLLPQRVWTLRKNGHEAAIDLRAVPGVVAEIGLTVDGGLRRTRRYRAHEQAELSGAIADTQAMLEANGVDVTSAIATGSAQRRRVFTIVIRK